MLFAVRMINRCEGQPTQHDLKGHLWILCVAWATEGHCSYNNAPRSLPDLLFTLYTSTVNSRAHLRFTLALVLDVSSSKHASRLAQTLASRAHRCRAFPKSLIIEAHALRRVLFFMAQ